MTDHAAEIPDCLPPVRETRRAGLEVPPGSVDCHTHVFVDGYPLIPNRGYNPPQSTLDDMLDAIREGDTERLIEITLRHLTIPVRD